MAILVGDKELKNIKELVGEEICIFKHRMKPWKKRFEYTLDFSVPMARFQGKLVNLKFNNRYLTLEAIIETPDGYQTLWVYPGDKYANNHGTWTPVTNNIFGKRVELQFVNPDTYLINH